jgi:hypothetical protein
VPVSPRQLGLGAALAALAVLVWFLDAPFSPELRGRHGDIGDEVACMQAKIGWNFVVHPLGVHRVWPLKNEATVPADQALHYKTHPPLCYLALGLAQAVCGREAWAVRLVPLVMCAVGLWLFYCLSRRVLGDAGVGLAVAFFATLPLTLKHGTGLGFEFFCQPVLLASWLVYLRDPQLRSGTCAALLGLWLFGAWSDIAGHYGALTVLADVALFRSDLPWRRRRWLIVGGAACAVVLFGGVQLHSALASGEAVEWLRISGSALEDPPAWRGFWDALWTHSQNLLGMPVLGSALLGLCWAAPSLLRGGNTAERAPARALVAILCAGLGHCLLLRRHTLVHEFWLSYTGPAVAGLAALFWLRVPVAPRARVGLAAALALVQLVSGVVYRVESIDPASRDFGRAIRACVDGDRTEVAVVPFAPGSDRPLGFYARALVVRGITREDQTLQAMLALHGAGTCPLILVLTPAEHAQHRAEVERLFPGIELSPCGSFLRADVTRHLRR